VVNRILVQERKRAGFTSGTRAFLDTLKGLIDDESDYWPVTVRRVFYAYIGRLGLRSDRGLYQKVSDVLLRARLFGEVPWEALEDRTRAVLWGEGWAGASSFAEQEKRNVLTGYRRDLQAGQPRRLEVWVEKDALAHIVHRAAEPYTVNVSVARGFASGSFKKECAERVEWAARQGQRTLILYFGDLDPSGAYMPVDVAGGLKHDMGLGDLVEVYHCGLLPEHVQAHALPSSIDAFKAGDTRARWFRETFGPDQNAVELDALPSADLSELVRVSLEAWIDPEALDREREAEAEDLARIEPLRERVLQAFGS
jgi:hypothetical protein